MALLDDRRRLFGLYLGLIVVPSVLLATLFAQSLQREYDREVASLPLEARDAAARLEAGLAGILDELFAREDARPFEQFAPEYAVGSVPGVVATERSPLVTGRRPEGLAAWVAIETTGAGAIDLFEGGTPLPDAEREALYLATGAYLRSYLAKDPVERIGDFADARAFRVSATELGVLLLGEDEIDRRCLEQYAHLLSNAAYAYGVTLTPFRPRAFRDPSGTPRLLATRRVLVSSPIEGALPLPEGAPCLDDLVGSLSLIQGFYVDVEWLTRALPRELSERLFTAAVLTDYREADGVVPLRPLAVAGLPEDDPLRDLGLLGVEVDVSAVRARHERTRRGFLGLGLMLLAAVVAGILLVYRRVRIEIEQAQRSEDFVAAVTHELRTPLSTIRLHGEMLAEGWTHDPEVQQAYYLRILSETERLSTLVERILQTSRIKRGVGGAPRPGNLNEEVARLEPALSGPGHDLAFELEPGLPLVQLTPEDVTSVLENLVENARKYAPVPAGGEPILVRTSHAGRDVLLEVLDRGPGVPPAERESIFEAFYRVGRERRRETRGTGLGLHLVRSAAERLGGSAEVRPRPGGGSVFQVRFPALRRAD